MLETKVFHHINHLKKIEDPLHRIEWLMRGCTCLFPFSRVSTYSFSPYNYVGQGILLLEDDKVVPLDMIKEDVRNIPSIYTALLYRKPQLIEVLPCGQNWPVKYIEQFQLSSLIIIPLFHNGTPIGIAIVDRYTINEYIKTELVEALYLYCQAAAKWLYPVERFRHHNLSKREIEAIQLLSYGHSTKEIAHVLGLSDFTVRDYLTSASRKLGTRHRAETVAVALREGIIH